MMYAYNMKFILFFVIAFFLVGVLAIPESSAQDVIPLWIKNNASWWADDKIDDFTFAQGIGFLIKNKMNFMICYVTFFLSLSCQEVD